MNQEVRSPKPQRYSEEATLIRALNIIKPGIIVSLQHKTSARVTFQHTEHVIKERDDSVVLGKQ